MDLVDDLGRGAAVQRALERADRAARGAEARSDWVDVITRAVNVEAFKPCSAPTMK